MQIESSFLLENPASRRSINSYQSDLNNIGAIKVVNGCAERGVKLSTDFVQYARSEDHYQNLLQVVEDDPRHLQNIRESVLYL